MQNTEQYDVIIIGAGAAGMMCAIEAGNRGRRVWLIDHYKKIGEKIRISGGGRCNFTNIHTSPAQFLSTNPHFCKSALKQFTQHDFIDLMNKHQIPFHEKKLGQLFCDESSMDIINMLLGECKQAGVEIETGTTVDSLEKTDAGYVVKTNRGESACESLVVATGGLSIPKIGATGFGYDIAKQFGLNVIETHAALVPLTFEEEVLDMCKSLTGISVEASISCGKITFAEGMLFTHRGLSGPSILQISSFWKTGQDILVNLATEMDVLTFLKERKKTHAKQDVQTVLSDILPKRLAQTICERENVLGRIADLPGNKLMQLGAAVNAWVVFPAGTEGYRTAEVTLGGVDTNDLSSQTMEAKNHPGLFFIGEVMDVTGFLGGYNFQWAWSSGYVAGQHV